MAVGTIFPNADIASSAWSTSPGGFIWQNTNDGNGATYAFTWQDGGWFIEGLPLPPIPAGQALSRLTFRWSASNTCEGLILNSANAAIASGAPWGAAGSVTYTPARPLTAAEVAALNPRIQLVYHGPSQDIGHNACSVNDGGLQVDWETVAIPAPTAETDAATNIAKRSVTLNGKVNTGGYPCTYWFEYGLDTLYGQQTTETSGGSPSALTAVSANVANLTPGQTYHYRLAVKNTSSGVVSYGDDVAFTLPRAGQQLLL